MKVLLSTTVPVLADITGAIESTNSLYKTIGPDRHSTSRRLRNGLQDLTNILDSLPVNDAEALALRGPIDRCSQLCYEFEQSIKVFSETLTTGFLDWGKMRFMGGDVDEFIDTLELYKSTISIGLGTITLDTCNASQEVAQKYREMIRDTLYNLEIHLHHIDERTKQMAAGDQFLRICREAKTSIESFTYQASTLRKPQNASEGVMQNKGQLPAVTLTCETLHGTGVSLGDTIGLLEEQNNQNPRNDKEILTLLREEGIATEECLKLCNMANDTWGERYSVGVGLGEAIGLPDEQNNQNPGNDKEILTLLREEGIATEECLKLCKTANDTSRKGFAVGVTGQEIVTTLADLFGVKNAWP